MRHRGTTDDRNRSKPSGKPSSRRVYEELDREVARRGPVCQLSGRCCRFEEYGHTLFVSTAEVQLPARRGPATTRSARSGRRPAHGRTHAATARLAKHGRWAAASIIATPPIKLTPTIFRNDSSLASRICRRSTASPGITPRCIATCMKSDGTEGFPNRRPPLHRCKPMSRSNGQDASFVPFLSANRAIDRLDWRPDSRRNQGSTVRPCKTYPGILLDTTLSHQYT